MSATAADLDLDLDLDRPPYPRAWLNHSGMTALFALTVRRLLRGRRLLSVVVLFLLPSLLAVLIRGNGGGPPPAGLEFIFLLNFFFLEKVKGREIIQKKANLFGNWKRKIKSSGKNQDSGGYYRNLLK